MTPHSCFPEILSSKKLSSHLLHLNSSHLCLCDIASSWNGFSPALCRASEKSKRLTVCADKFCLAWFAWCCLVKSASAPKGVSYYSYLAVPVALKSEIKRRTLCAWHSSSVARTEFFPCVNCSNNPMRVEKRVNMGTLSAIHQLSFVIRQSQMSPERTIKPQLSTKQTGGAATYQKRTFVCSTSAFS